MPGPKVRKSQEDWKIERDEFKKRFHHAFFDPAFDPHREKISELEALAWDAYSESRKSPKKQKAGEGFSDPEFELSVEWLKAHEALKTAEEIHSDPKGPLRVLLISASDRNDHTCPGEMSKTWRLKRIAEETLREDGVEVEVLDLSLLSSEFGKVIYPCKACVSTAMPLCHWPCSCYPNHALRQVDDWMNDIYPMWVRAHGIMIITPVYWHQVPGALKLMIDRLVCADGGNPDPTSTDGKDPKKAKRLELNGWNYPRHLEGRVFSVIVHGDTTGVDEVKTALTSWLTEMMLIPSGIYGDIARYIGYYGTYAESHEALDRDTAIMEEVKQGARVLALNVRAERAKRLDTQIPDFEEPRPK